MHAALRQLYHAFVVRPDSDPIAKPTAPEFVMSEVCQAAEATSRRLRTDVKCEAGRKTGAPTVSGSKKSATGTAEWAREYGAAARAALESCMIGGP